MSRISLCLENVLGPVLDPYERRSRKNSPTYPAPRNQHVRFNGHIYMCMCGTTSVKLRCFDLLQPRLFAQVIVDIDLLGFVYHWGLDINSITVIGEFILFLSGSAEIYIDTRQS